MEENLLEIKKLSIKYGKEDKYALKSINLSIKKGQLISLIGKSGSGKTSLCNAINGLIPNFIKADFEGDIFYKDKNLKEIEFLEVGKHIGSVYQHPKLQFFTSKVFSELAFAAENYEINPKLIREKSSFILDFFKIRDKYRENLSDLSAGQQQLIAIGSIYNLDPDLYIMDEPTSNLDEENIKRLIELIKNLKARGKSLIITDHRIHELIGISDRFIYLNEGRIESELSPEELLSIKDYERKSMGIRKLTRPILEDKKISKKDIKIENISYKPRKLSKNLIEVDRLELPTNKIIGLYGENGIGKSSLIKALYGMRGSKKDFYLKGKSISNKLVRKNSYLVFQNSTRQFFEDSLTDEFRQAGDLSDEQIAKILEKIGLASYQDRHPLSLSGGERQRLAIVLSLIQNRKYIYLDEPTSGLDYKNMELVSNLLRENIPQDGYIFIVSHDVEFLNHLADEIIDGNKILNKNT